MLILIEIDIEIEIEIKLTQLIDAKIVKQIWISLGQCVTVRKKNERNVFQQQLLLLIMHIKWHLKSN